MQPITKDTEVEVSYEEDGVKGAWYRAILEDSPTKSQRKLLRVRYRTLLKEDLSSHLTEIVDHSLIRPVPPKDDGAEEFEEGSVVDAYYKGGWWSGLVVKRKEEDGTYLVYFDSPPDINQFERKQLRAHLDWSGSKWVRPENKELGKSEFSSGTMVELRWSSAWRPAMIIKKVENEERFIVKYCDDTSFRCSKRSRISVIDSREVRPRQPLCSVGEYELLDRVEVVVGSVWCEGVVRGIVFKGRYMVSFGETKVASVQVSCSDVRPPMEWEDGIWHKRPKTKSKFFGKFYCRKRKRGHVQHKSDLNDTVRTPTSNVEDTQATDTMRVLPFANKSPLWKIYETMEVFKKLPQRPHFSPLIESTSEDFREGSALGMMATFSGLLEKLKDMEADVTVSELDSLKDTFTKQEEHGFDVTRPLSRINKLLALKGRQLKILEGRRGLDKERMDESSKRHKAELEFGETERKMVEVKRKILELQRQETALKEKKEAAEEHKDQACRKIWKVESCARDLGVKLEDVEFDFETIVSAPW
ncbi:hypothetical protein BRARA_H00702 [Brassica rapa]|uniref:Agenet domain-containing protein n=1 Tax=Brassica campestris TaxID=3711 RepID=A0A397Y8W5_BRACM|nr:hypothetical protein BRARA_H00702 [Brassica rapa]RID49941.1 hypothetical protein BRARA_H00702 [Brassica rapa]